MGRGEAGPPIGPAPWWLLLVFSLGLGVLLLDARGTLDVNVLLNWNSELARHGLVAGYAATGTDYPPFSLLIVAGAVQVTGVLGLPAALGLKLSIFLGLLLTMLAVHLVGRDGIVTALLPAGLLLNSVALGYIDVYFAPFVMIALYCLARQRLVPGTALFAVACLIKWQVLILAPFVVVYVLDVQTMGDVRRRPWGRLLRTAVLPPALVAGGTLAVFGPAVLQSLDYALTRSTYLSGTALNFNWILTYLLHRWDPATYGPLADGRIAIITTENLAVTLGPRLVFAGLYLWNLVRFFRAPKTLPAFLVYATLGYLAYFEFNTGVHENHLFLVGLLLSLLAAHIPAARGAWALWTLIANANLLAFYGIDGRGLPFSPVVQGLDITLVLAALSVISFGWWQVAAMRSGWPGPPALLERHDADRLGTAPPSDPGAIGREGPIGQR